MQKLNILVVGRHQEILETVVRLLNNNADWKATGAKTNVEAVQAFDHTHFDLIMLTNGIEPEDENNLRAYFTDHRPEVKVIQHYGGGSGLLMAEIYEACPPTS